MAFKREYKEFIIIKVNFNIIREDDEEYLYKEDDFYFELNNAGYNDIIWINYIYDYYIFYLGSKTIYNFFFKTIFRFIRKTYRKEKTRHWILTIKTMMYGIFISLFKYPPMCIKEGTTLERY